MIGSTIRFQKGQNKQPFKKSTGFSFEIKATHEAMNSGQIECPVMPLDETAAIAQTLDRLQSQFKAD